MIVGSLYKYQLGTRHEDILCVHDGNDGITHVRTPFVVLREATYQEYLEDLKNYPTVDPAFNWLPGTQFYKISVD